MKAILVQGIPGVEDDHHRAGRRSSAGRSSPPGGTATAGPSPSGPREGGTPPVPALEARLFFPSGPSGASGASGARSVGPVTRSEVRPPMGGRTGGARARPSGEGPERPPRPGGPARLLRLVVAARSVRDGRSGVGGGLIRTG